MSVINRDTFVVTLNQFTNPPYYSKLRIQNPPNGFNYYSIYGTKTVNLLNNFSQIHQISRNGQETFERIITTCENDSIVYSHKNIDFNDKFIQVVEEDIPKLGGSSITLVFSFFVNQPLLLRKSNLKRVETVNYTNSDEQSFELKGCNNFNNVQIFSNISDSVKITGLVTNIISTYLYDDESIIPNNKFTYYECLKNINNITITYKNQENRKDIYFTFLFY